MGPHGHPERRPLTTGSQDFEELVALLRDRHGPALRSLILFGSCLSPAMQKPGSIPDLFAFVEDVPAALRREGVGGLARRVARALPPTTIALHAPWRREAVAKLNLIEPSTVRAELQAPRDLYLAGRLGKHTRTLWSRDDACAREIGELLDQAAARIVEIVLGGLPAQCPLELAVQRCVAISYEAEIRPESDLRVQATYRAFAAEYQARYRPLLVSRAGARGFEVRGDTLVDARGAESARRDQRGFRALLLRSRVRSVARWPKQALVYRGWYSYVLGKIRRARVR